MKKKVMKKAWEIARQGVEKFGGSVRSYFSISLKMAWAEIKSEHTTAEHTTAEHTTAEINSEQTASLSECIYEYKSVYDVMHGLRNEISEHCLVGYSIVYQIVHCLVEIHKVIERHSHYYINGKFRLCFKYGGRTQKSIDYSYNYCEYDDTVFKDMLLKACLETEKYTTVFIQELKGRKIINEYDITSDVDHCKNELRDVKDMLLIYNAELYCGYKYQISYDDLYLILIDVSDKVQYFKVKVFGIEYALNYNLNFDGVDKPFKHSIVRILNKITIKDLIINCICYDFKTRKYCYDFTLYAFNNEYCVNEKYICEYDDVKEFVNECLKCEKITSIKCDDKIVDKKYLKLLLSLFE